MILCIMVDDMKRELVMMVSIAEKNSADGKRLYEDDIVMQSETGRILPHQCLQLSQACCRVQLGGAEPNGEASGLQ